MFPIELRKSEQRKEVDKNIFRMNYYLRENELRRFKIRMN